MNDVRYPILKEPELLALVSSENLDPSDLTFGGQYFNIYEDGLTQKGSLRRYLKMFGPELDAIKGYIDNLPNNMDIDTVSSDYIPNLGQLVGVTVDTSLPISQQREQVRSAVPMYKRKGTLPGIELLGYYAIGITPDAYEYVYNVLWFNMVPWVTGLGFTTVISRGTSGTKVYVVDTQGFEATARVLIENAVQDRDIRTITSVGFDTIDDVDYYYLDLDLAPSIDVTEGAYVARIVEDYEEFSQSTIIEWWGMMLPFDGVALEWIGLPFDPVGHFYDELYQNVATSYFGTILGSSGGLITPPPAAANLEENNAWVADMTGPDDLPKDWIIDLEDPIEVMYVRIKAGLGLNRFEIDHSDDGISFFFVEEFQYGETERHIAGFSVVSVGDSSNIYAGAITLTDPPPTILQVTGQSQAGTLSVPLYVGDTSIINPGVTVDTWLEITDGTISQLFQVTAIEGNLALIQPAATAQFPIGSAVNALTTVILGSYTGLVSIDPIRGVITNVSLAAGNYIIDVYKAVNSPVNLPWQVYKLETKPGSHRYWRVRVLSTWGLAPSIQCVNLTSADWTMTEYACDKLGLYFNLPCDVEEPSNCVAPEVCSCNPPIWLTMDAVADLTVNAVPVMPHCYPCDNTTGPCGDEDYEYQFDWGDGITGWLAYSAIGFTHTYITALPGPDFYIRVRVRKVTDHSCISSWYHQRINVEAA